MKRSKTFKIGLALFLIPFILGMIYYNKLPDQIPTHFDINGNPDSYSSKAFGLFGVHGIMIGVYILAYLLTNIDPKKKNQGDKALNVVLIILPLLSTIISAITIAFSLGRKVDINLIMSALLGLTFILIGNYLPKVKRNYTIGVRYPWTLDSDYVWDKTHILAGKVFMAGGFLLILASLLFNKLWVFVTIVGLMVLVPGVYSYIIYKNLALGDGEDEK